MRVAHLPQSQSAPALPSSSHPSSVSSPAFVGAPGGISILLRPGRVIVEGRQLRGWLRREVAHPGGELACRGDEGREGVGRGGGVAGRVVGIFKGMQGVGLGSGAGRGPARAPVRGRASGLVRGEAAGACRQRLWSVGARGVRLAQAVRRGLLPRLSLQGSGERRRGRAVRFKACPGGDGIASLASPRHAPPAPSLAGNAQKGFCWVRVVLKVLEGNICGVSGGQSWAQAPRALTSPDPTGFRSSALWHEPAGC